MKTLVTYFSASGVTAKAAEKVASIARADLKEIVPLVPYTKADLNWMNPSSRSSVEMKDTSSHPELAGKIDNINDYDFILIGFPIWWYTAPRIINTFLAQHPLQNKKVAFFATSGGSNLDKAVKDLSSLFDSSNQVVGKIMLNHADEGKISSWLDSLI